MLQEQHPVSPATQRRYDEIAAELAGAGVKASSMFGMPTLKRNGKALGGLWGDAMTFKLAPEAVAAALRLPGVQQFDPSGSRPMKAWVVVPLEQSAEWERLARLALAATDA
ncbi:MAG: hypothetical protein ABI864_06800 [Chloroflexota bacterium]